MNKLAYVTLVNYYPMLEIDILVDIFSYVALFYSGTDILFMYLSFIHLLWHEKLLYRKQTRPLSSHALRMSEVTFSGSLSLNFVLSKHMFEMSVAWDIKV